MPKGFSKAYEALGQTYLGEKEYSLAENNFRKALRFDNQNQNAIEGFVEACKIQEKYSLAIKILKRFIKQTQNSSYQKTLKELEKLSRPNWLKKLLSQKG